MSDVKSQLKSYICKNLMGLTENELNDSDSLFRERRLDSLNMAELLGFIEQTFDIKIGPLEITFENFDSINEMSHFIKQKKNPSL